MIFAGCGVNALMLLRKGRLFLKML